MHRGFLRRCCAAVDSDVSGNEFAFLVLVSAFVFGNETPDAAISDFVTVREFFLSFEFVGICQILQGISQRRVRIWFFFGKSLVEGLPRRFLAAGQPMSVQSEWALGW